MASQAEIVLKPLYADFGLGASGPIELLGMGRQLLPVVLHGDDVDLIGPDAVDDAKRPLQHLAQVSLGILRHLAPE